VVECAVTIFSAVDRTDPSPSRYGGSHYEFLDRVAGHYWDQVRDLIEDWFSRLCPDAQPDVSGRLRSHDDRQSNGAFFELYLHECLLRMGYTVTCHPEIKGTPRRPDFLAEKDGRSIYIEARSTSASDADKGSAALKNAVYESIDKIDSPNFLLWIQVKKQGKSALSAKSLRGRLERWLRGLDPDVVAVAGKRREDLPGLTHDDAGWSIDFRAIPKAVDARGKEGVRPLGVLGGGEAGWVDDAGTLRRALSDKGTAYGSLGAAFVVAVASGGMTLDEHDVLDALYGTSVMEIGFGPDGAETHTETRSPDGYWYAGDHWSHRGVSAVLVVTNLHSAAVGGQQHTLWEHPHPDVAVGEFPIWRRALVGDDAKMTFADPPRTQADWFGLNDPWPVGDPFPRKSKSPDTGKG
jgi:hypothetical protein